MREPQKTTAIDIIRKNIRKNIDVRTTFGEYRIRIKWDNTLVVYSPFGDIMDLEIFLKEYGEVPILEYAVWRKI